MSPPISLLSQKPWESSHFLFLLSLIASPLANPASPVPGQMWNLTTDHQLPPSQPRSLSSLLWIMHCPPHWTLLPLLPCRTCLLHSSRGHHIIAQPSASQFPPFHLDESKAFSQRCRVCLPPASPASSPDAYFLRSGLRLSLFPAYISVCLRQGLPLALLSASDVLPPNILTAAPFIKDPTPK